MSIMEVSLNDLADLIQHDLTRSINSRQEWIDANFDLCIHVATARGHFRTDDTAFGDWLAKNNIKEDQFNKPNRLAAIHMGQHPEALRRVLENTTRSSLQLIFKIEFPKDLPNRFAREKTKPKSSRAKPREKPALERALHAYDRRKVAGEPITREAIVKEAGVSDAKAQEAITMRQAEERMADEKAKLSKSKQAQYEAAVRAEQKRLQLEFETRVNAEVQKILDEMILPARHQSYEKLMNEIRYRKGVLKYEEYRKLQRCLHPDSIAYLNPNQETIDAFNEAFRILKYYELALCNEKERPVDPGRAPPKTVAEWRARKAEVAAKKKAEQATRKQQG